MKLITAAVFLLVVSGARAQGNLSPNFVPISSDDVAKLINDSKVPAPAPLIPISSAVLAPSDWVKIGGAFGKPDANGRSWQFGFDKSDTAGGCLGWNMADSEFIGGPCRDVFILAHHQQRALHVGFMFGWDSSHAHSAIVGRLGINVGPATAASLNYIGDKIPMLEALGSFSAPAPLAYIGKITNFDFMYGPRTNAAPDKHFLVYGPEIQATLPLADLWAMVGGK